MPWLTAAGTRSVQGAAAGRENAEGLVLTEGSDWILLRIKDKHHAKQANRHNVAVNAGVRRNANGVIVRNKRSDRAKTEEIGQWAAFGKRLSDLMTMPFSGRIGKNCSEDDDADGGDDFYCFRHVCVWG
ncbi:MAG: hypothetical protein KGN37_07350 [Burkholderiales bacterium]|nr:hypothetical protein [Burkholderiales bacterium]